MIDDSDISVEGGWTCNNKGCSACLPERERILGLPIGNVVSCDCEAPTYGQEPHCELSTSGDNLGETIRKIISIIIPFL